MVFATWLGQTMGSVNRTVLDSDEPRRRANPLDQSAGGKQKVFVVEDDLDIARLVRHHLESAGYKVRSYTSTTGVLADAQKERPSLRSEEHTSELQSRVDLVCRLLLEKKETYENKIAI